MSLMPSFTSNVLYWLDLIYNDDAKVYVRRVGRVICYKTPTYFNILTVTHKRTKAFLANFDIQWFFFVYLYFLSLIEQHLRQPIGETQLITISFYESDEPGKLLSFDSKVYQIFIMLTERVLNCDIL